VLQEERLQIILDMVNRESAVQIGDLAEILQVSESTVRRDIDLLDESGSLKRVFGGAVSIQPETKKRIIAREKGMAEKNVLHVEEKRLIAQYAATLIEDDDFVFIDAGSSTFLLADYLTNTQAAYVTNGLRHALRLAERGFRVYVLPGQAKYLTEVIYGSLAVESLSRYEFTKAFIGTNGIDAEKGLTTPDVEEAMVKAEAVKRASKAYVLADNSKFGSISAVSFASIDEVVIITDKCPEESYKKLAVIEEVNA